MNEIKDRLLIFIKYLDIAPYAFERECGLGNGYISKMGRIQKATLSLITKRYPELNTDWLLNGKGEMIKPISEQLKDDGAHYLMDLLRKVTDRLEADGESFRVMAESNQRLAAQVERLVGMVAEGRKLPSEKAG